MPDMTLPIQMAPQTLSQSILPGWQFSLFSVNVGDSSDPALERAAVRRAGSYGKQIGHIAEALEVVIEHMKLLDSSLLTQDKKKTLKVFLDDVAAIRDLKSAAGVLGKLNDASA